MKSLVRLGWLLCLCCCAWSLKAQETVKYQADTIFYNNLKRTIQLQGHSQIDYKHSKLTADSIFIDVDKNIAIANGKPALFDNNEKIDGSELFLDIKKQKGLIRNGRTEFQKGYYSGDEIRLVARKTLDVDNGYFTSCPDSIPHFYFWSKRLRIYLGDRLVAQPVVMYIYDLPVLALPAMWASIRRDRHSGFLLPEPGFRKNQGKYIKNLAYFQTLGDYADAKLRFDFWENRGWTGWLYFRYRWQTYLNRLTFRQYLPQNSYESRSFSIQWTHLQTMFGGNFNLNLYYANSQSAHFLGDDFANRNSESIRSTLNFSKNYKNQSLTIYNTYSENLVSNQKSLVLPKLTYRLNSFSLWKQPKGALFKPIRMSYNFLASHEGKASKEARNWQHIFWDSEVENGQYIAEHHLGAKHSISLSATQKLWGWQNWTPSLNFSEFWFDGTVTRDSLNQIIPTTQRKFARAYDWNLGLRFNCDIYGSWLPNYQYFKGLRHIISPSITWNYAPKIERDEEYPALSNVNVSSGSKVSRFNFSLTNKYQVKYANLQGEEKKLNDLFRIQTSFSYNQLAKTDKFSDVTERFSLNPGSLTHGDYSISPSFSYTIVHPFKKWKIGKRTFNINWQIGFPWYTQTDSKVEKETTNASFHYARNSYHNETTETGGGSLSLQLTQNWHADYSFSANIKTKTIYAQSISLHRDLHCWEMLFTWEKNESDWEYRLQINSKVFSESLKLRLSGDKE